MRRFMTTVAAGTLFASGALAQTAVIDAGKVETEGESITLARVTAAQDGYIVIHAMKDGKPVVPGSLGNAAVTTGDNTGVKVTFDAPLKKGESYVAMLHAESNGNGTYDFGEGSTDVDQPVKSNGEIVAAEFKVRGEKPAMSNKEAAQKKPKLKTNKVSVDGTTVTIPSVTIDKDGYVTIHAVQDGEPIVPASIGNAEVRAGKSKDVQVTTDYPLEEGEDYVAMLHYETNGNGQYDFAEGATDVDTPVLEDGAPLTSRFQISAGSKSSGAAEKAKIRMGSMMKGDANRVTFAKISAQEDGYIVIHEMQDGKPVVPGSIGNASVKAGDNSDVTVTTDKELSEDSEYAAMLHAETNGNATYDFGEGSTDVDTPVTVNGKPVVITFSK